MRSPSLDDLPHCWRLNELTFSVSLSFSSSGDVAGTGGLAGGKAVPPAPTDGGEKGKGPKKGKKRKSSGGNGGEDDD